MKRTFLFLLICLLVNSSYSQTYNFEFSISDFSIVENNGKHMIGYPTSFDVTNNTCEPILPSCVKNILLPPNKKVSNYSVTYTATNWQTNIDLEAMPMMHPTDGGDYVDVPCSYDLKVYPDSIVRYGRVCTIDNYRYASFVITPFVYDATIGLLSFVNQVNITLELTDATESYNAPTQNKVIKQIVHNPNDVDLYYQQSRNQTSTTQNIDYLIITADSLKNSFEPLRIWKTQKGVYTKIITLSEIYSNYNGATPQLKIKRCIQDYYDNHGLKWVLLGGDDVIIPCVKAYAKYIAKDQWGVIVETTEETIPADIFYTCFDGAFDWNANGNDTIGELTDNVILDQVVNISRLPIKTNAHIQTYVSKLLKYEQTPKMTDPSMLVCAQKLWNYKSGTGYSDAHLKSNIFINSITPYWDGRIVRFYDTYTDFEGGANYQLNSSNLTKQLSDNYNFLHFATHGNTNIWALEEGYYFSSTVNNIAESNPIVIVTMACNTNAFDNDEPCLSEAFIRKAKGGAIAYLGSSRFAWESATFNNLGASFSINKKFFSNLFTGVSNHFSEIVKLVKQHYQSSAYSYENTYRWLLFSNNAIGDAELPIFTTIPNKFENVRFERIGTDIMINTGDIDNCVITISNIGNGGEYYCTYKNTSSAVFTNVPNDYRIVITKDNYVPYIIERDCYIASEVIIADRIIEGCANTLIGDKDLELYQMNQAQANIGNMGSNIDGYPISLGQVRILTDGLLRVYNEGTVTIEKLRMEKGSELYIHNKED